MDLAVSPNYAAWIWEVWKKSDFVDKISKT
jgi:hypothetical protein